MAKVPVYISHCPRYQCTYHTVQGTSVHITLSKVPVYISHCPRYQCTYHTVQGTSVPITLSKVPVYISHCPRYQCTYHTVQGTSVHITLSKVPVYISHCPRYQCTYHTVQGTSVPITLSKVPVYISHCPRYQCTYHTVQGTSVHITLSKVPVYLSRPSCCNQSIYHTPPPPMSSALPYPTHTPLVASRFVTLPSAHSTTQPGQNLRRHGNRAKINCGRRIWGGIDDDGGCGCGVLARDWWVWEAGARVAGRADCGETTSPYGSWVGTCTCGGQRAHCIIAQI